MSDVTVTVEPVVVSVTVVNPLSGPEVAVEAVPAPVIVSIAQIGPRGPVGPEGSGDLDPEFIVDGGNF